MNKEQKRKLRNISLLVLAGLIGGTFAFTAFNQQAINDRENQVQVNVGGRVHDYYSRDTENKDVFVENYGERPIMARIRLSEFLETQQTGDTDFTPLVDGTERENLDTWTTYIPSATNLGTRTGAGAAFNRYSNLRFGRAGEAPWYLPTFNHNNLDLSTAAAGDARDYVAEGATHPGDGTDAFWSEDETYTNGQGPTNTVWPGASDGATRDTAQNLQQERAPMTIEQWEHLPNSQKIGNFWVIDHNTGWAYWASMLEPEEATSYLLDAAEMTNAIEDTVFNGTYYYGIHVDSQLISLDHSATFLEADSEGEHSDLLYYFLEGIKNNAFGNGNPAYNVNSQPEDFRFHLMNPGRIFTMAGEEYRYLENMGDGNHLIIRNTPIYGTSFVTQGATLTNFFESLSPEVQEIVSPVSIPTSVPSISQADVDPWTYRGLRWLPAEWEQERFNAVRADRTAVNTGGTRQAFALSLADVVRLSTDEGPFRNHAQRSGNGRWWWLRTPGAPGAAWLVHHATAVGVLDGTLRVDYAHAYSGGVRPALIINQPTN